MNLSAVDLNLFLVLHAVLETGSATGAARQLHVTQSAVSNALARLRDVLGDPLLVRSGRGLVPTPRCEALRPLITSAVAQLQAAVDGHQFNPAESTRQFTIAFGDNQHLRDMPLIVEAFSRRMPLAKLRVVSIDYLIANDGLATGDVDASIGPEQAGEREGLFTEPLYLEQVVFLARKDHPHLKGTVLTKEAFNAARHVDLHISHGRPGIGHRLFDKVMREHGLTQNTMLTVGNFIAAAVAVSRTDYIVGMPARTADALCRMLPLKQLELQLTPKLPPMTMSLIWHTRTHADPGSRAFRELVIDVLRESSVPRRQPAARPSRRAS